MNPKNEEMQDAAQAANSVNEHVDQVRATEKPLAGSAPHPLLTANVGRGAILKNTSERSMRDPESGFVLPANKSVQCPNVTTWIMCQIQAGFVEVVGQADKGEELKTIDEDTADLLTGK